ncbi:MAG: glycerate kinase [Betaproteobacteria bacterium]|nr:glycerate kinase [Betaproteobacteria bacterium]
MWAMNIWIQKVAIPLGAIAGIILAFEVWGWQGVALAVGAVVFWMLLHFNRLMQVVKRAAERPLGYVDSAVMLNAKLNKGATLMHVVAMTRALGALQTPPNQQPELYRWTDNSDSWVEAEFLDGKLVRWQLVRPTEPSDAAS